MRIESLQGKVTSFKDFTATVENFELLQPEVQSIARAAWDHAHHAAVNMILEGLEQVIEHAEAFEYPNLPAPRE